MSILKNITLAILILLIVPFFAINAYETWIKPVELIPEKEFLKKSEVKKSPILSSVKNEAIPIQTYIFISEKNIFSPERKDFPIIKIPEVTKQAEIKKPNPRPQIILYGITISGDYKTAIISNPKDPRQKVTTREMMNVKLGEHIGEYRLSNVMPDKIILESPGDSFEVLLYDPKTPKKRVAGKTEIKPANITSVTSTPLTPPPPLPEIPISITPKEVIPEKVVPSTPVPQTPPPTFPSTEQRRGRRIVYPPPPTQPTQEQIRGGNGGI